MKVSTSLLNFHLSSALAVLIYSSFFTWILFVLSIAAAYCLHHACNSLLPLPSPQHSFKKVSRLMARQKPRLESCLHTIKEKVRLLPSSLFFSSNSYSQQSTSTSSAHRRGTASKEKTKKHPISRKSGTILEETTSSVTTGSSSSSIAASTSTESTTSQPHHRSNRGAKQSRKIVDESSNENSILSKEPIYLVLDLDETLVRSTAYSSKNHDHMLEVIVENHICLYYIYNRPHLDFFLRTLSQWYTLTIFTASMAEYADPVITYLDRHHVVEKRFYRDSCTPFETSYVKNLGVVHPDMRRVCIVDNSPVAYYNNQENGIPISGWYRDTDDESLLDLIPFLDALRFTDDVRSILSLRLHLVENEEVLNESSKESKVTIPS